MSTKMDRYKQACGLIEGIIMHREMNQDDIVDDLITKLWDLVEKDNYKFNPLHDGEA